MYNGLSFLCDMSIDSPLYYENSCTDDDVCNKDSNNIFYSYLLHVLSIHYSYLHTIKNVVVVIFSLCVTQWGGNFET